MCPVFIYHGLQTSLQPELDCNSLCKWDDHISALIISLECEQGLKSFFLKSCYLKNDTFISCSLSKF